MLGDASGVSGADWREEEEKEESSNSPKQIMQFTNTSEHTLIFLVDMLNEHVYMKLVSLSKKFSLH